MRDITPLQIGQAIRRHRKASRLTLREAEVLSGVGYATISKFEHGHMDLRSCQVWRLCRAVGVQPSALLLEIER